MTTPLELEIAIWYGTRAAAGDTRSDNFNTPAGQAALKGFIDAGLLTLNADGYGYRATGGMITYLAALCDVPWPKQEWVIPRRDL